MENTKYQYITLKVETKEENTEAKKLLSLGWVPLINQKGFITFFNIAQ
jgi:hypothetical protein